MNPNIKIEKLSPEVVLPEQQTPGSVGYDLYLPYDIVVNPGRHILPLNFKIEMPVGIYGTITPRSGFSAKGMEGVEIPGNVPCHLMEQLFNHHDAEDFIGRYDIDVLIGRIDSDYRGEVGVIVKSNEKNPIFLFGGTRIAQMIFQRYEQVDFTEVSELSETERGEGGFQSTGA